MKTMNFKNAFALVVLSAGVVLFSAFFYSSTPTPDKWVVPASAMKAKNPTTADKASLAVGKMLYGKHCKSCHGTKGLGDGSKAGELDTDCGDFTAADFKAQTDGALFYKTKEGRDDMPSFKKKIPEDEDIWFLVNYMRKF